MKREQRTLRSLFPDPKPPHRKNFIKENVKNLRRMEQLFHTNNKNDLKQAKILSKHHGIGDSQNFNINGFQKLNITDTNENETSKLSNQNSFPIVQKNRQKPTYLTSNKKVSQKLLRPSVNENTRQSYYYKNHKNKTENLDELKAHSEGNLHKKVNQIETKNEFKTKSKHQGVQTLDTNDLECLYSEGIIRYPTGRSKETQSKSCDTNNLTKKSENNEIDIKKFSEYTANGVNHIKLNKDQISIAQKLANKLNGTAQPSHRIGVVPRYIKERKEILQKEQAAKAAARNSDCPIGHIPIPDNERVHALSLFKKNYQEYVNELNMLPIRTDTLRSQKRKMEIEKQLAKLEEGIKIFSRPKVFVSVDS